MLERSKEWFLSPICCLNLILLHRTYIKSKSF